MQQFRPLGERILVRPLRPTVKATPGSFDPGTTDAEDEILRGVCVGAGETLVWLVNLTVAYAQFSGRTIKLGGESLLILTEEEVVGLFIEETE